jgi:hypothetical protein
MTSAPRRPKADEAPPPSRTDRRQDVALETFEQDARRERDTSRVAQDDPDGAARTLDPSPESREAAVDET